MVSWSNLLSGALEFKIGEDRVLIPKCSGAASMIAGWEMTFIGGLKRPVTIWHVRSTCIKRGMRF